MSLAKIGETIDDPGFQKGETPDIFKNAANPDFQNYLAITDEMVQYGVQDCRVLWRGMQEFWCVVKELGYHGTSWPLTIGTLGFQMMADHIAKSDDMQPKIVKKIKNSWKYRAVVNDPWADDVCRLALVGGRTQVFNNLPQDCRVVKIDARSHYPSAELGGSIQVGSAELPRTWPNTTSYTRIRPGNLGDDFTDQDGAVHVSWKRPASDKLGIIAGMNEDGLLDWTLQEGVRWITIPQYRYAAELGYELKVIPWIGIEESDGVAVDQELVAILTASLDYCPFRAVKGWFDYRKELKARGDPKQILVKLLMNAGSYGKWVQQQDQQLICSEQDFVHNYSEDWSFDLVHGVFGYASKQLKVRAKNTAHLIGCYITDYARMSLAEMGKLLGVQYLLYTDTDSWAFIDSGVDLEDHIGKELGQWAIEQIIDFWLSVSPKQYKYHAIEEDGVACDSWRIKVKGCSLGKLSQEEIASFDLLGIASYERVVGVRESWRNGSKAGTWIDQEKDIGGRLRE
jgi:hypothetical protein